MQLFYPRYVRFFVFGIFFFILRLGWVLRI